MIYLKLLLTAVFWGGTFIAGRMLAGHVAPFAAAFLRFTLAAGLLLLILYRRHGKLPAVPTAMRLPLVVLGLTGVFIYNVFFFGGLQYIRAAVIIANNPVMIALGAALVFGIRLDRVQSAGVLISVIGAVLAISGGHPIALFKGGLGWGDLLIFGCTLSWAAFSLVGKTVVARIPPLTAIAYSATIGAALLLIPALIEGMAGRLASYSFSDWSSLAYLGVFGTVLGFVWFYEGIEKIGPTRAALFINFVPISALCLAWLILKEPLTRSLAAGTVMVICGVYLTNNGLSLPLWFKKQTRVV